MAMGARTPQSRLRLFAALLVLCVIVGFAAEARGDVRRFALIVGNNRGDADEPLLRYAEEDARRMDELMQRYGNMERRDMELVLGGDSDRVRRKLIDLNDRIRRAASDPKVHTFLFVFYSGHADPRALHLDGTHFDLDELKQLVSGSPANMRVLIVDACYSGALTGVKGARPAPPFPLEIENRLEAEGVAFLSSSAAGELSQESEHLRGSFFSHYLMVGMRGVADVSGDGKVSLLEAFDYARQRTLWATSRTLVGTQHPTFDYDIQGHADVILTDLSLDTARRATLVFRDPGEYLVFAGEHGPLVAEVVTPSPWRRLVLAAGHYVVRLRTPAELRERHVLVEPGAMVTIAPEGMGPIAYLRLAPKGAYSRGRRHGPQASLHYRGETLQDFGGMMLGGVSYAVLLGRLWFRPRLLFGGSDFRVFGSRVRQFELQGDLLLSHGFDLRYLVLLVGAGTGGVMLRQEVSGVEEPANVTTGGFVFSGHLELMAPIASGVYVSVGGEALGVLLPTRGGGGGGGADWRMTPSYRIGIGLGYTL